MYYNGKQVDARIEKWTNGYPRNDRCRDRHAMCETSLSHPYGKMMDLSLNSAWKEALDPTTHHTQKAILG